MMQTKYQVSIAQCTQYQSAQIDEAVEQALLPFGGLSHFIQPGERVLLKLNLLSPVPPERAVTTHPEVVRAVIRLVQACGATPVVGDSPGGMCTRASFLELLKITGIQPVLDDTGCASILLDEETTEFSSAQSRVFKRLIVAKAPLQVDKVICLPKLKTHQYMAFTGAVKLLYGYLPGITKVEYHLHAGKDHATFADLLLDIYETFPPTLTIMDAVVGMDGNGPAHGSPKQIGLMLASDNGPALDFVATNIVGLLPEQVPTIKGAMQRGIGPASLEEITVQGPALAKIRLTDFQPAAAIHKANIPGWITKLSEKFANKPVIDKTTCIRCGKCAANCPPHAITCAKGGLPEITYATCMRCFCCHELCPVGAIHVGAPRFRLPAGLSDGYFKLSGLLHKLRNMRRTSKTIGP